MATVLDMITDAMQDANVIAIGEAPTNADAQKAFRLLNRMLDSWSAENLLIYDQAQEVFNFTSGQETYTIGSGGDFNTTRPVSVNLAYVRDTSGNDIPVEVLGFADYASIISKQVQSTIPLAVYYNSSVPLGSLSFWPIPTNTTYRFVLWSWKVLSSFTNLTDNIVFPPGYEDAIEVNLAVRICIAYNRDVPVELQKWANQSKGQIKRINLDPPTLILGTSNLNYSTFPISPSILSGM